MGALPGLAPQGSQLCCQEGPLQPPQVLSEPLWVSLLCFWNVGVITEPFSWGCCCEDDLSFTNHHIQNGDGGAQATLTGSVLGGAECSPTAGGPRCSLALAQQVVQQSTGTTQPKPQPLGCPYPVSLLCCPPWLSGRGFTPETQIRLSPSLPPPHPMK